MTKPISDANDLLQAFNEDGIAPNMQSQQANELLQEATPFIIYQAKRIAAIQNVGERNDALKTFFSDVVATLDKQDRAGYKNLICKTLGITKHEWNERLKILDKFSDDKDEIDKEIIYSYGGRVGDWLLEYCYDPEKKKSRWAYRSPNGTVDMADEIEIDGIVYRPASPTDRMVTDGVVLFPSELGPRKNIKEIVSIITAILKRNYLFHDPKIPQLAAYYIMLTWMYDNFSKLCYLRAVGDAGAGKSELMELIGHMCYRFTHVNGADTLATFFRVTDVFRGTVFFEEADLPDNSDASNPIVKFINMGAMDGNYILRMDEYVRPDGTKGYRPTPFRTFCPKLFAMRADFDDDAVGSRSITFRLEAADMQELIDNHIPLELTEEFKTKTALEVRNMALTWRLHNYQLDKRKLTHDLADPLVSARMNQVTMPILALAGDDEDFKHQIRLLLRNIYAETVLERSQTIEALVVEAIWKIYTLDDLQERIVVQNDGTLLIKIGDVRAIANNLLEEINEEGNDLRLSAQDEEEKTRKRKNREISSRRVGKFIREGLHLHVPPRRGTGFYFVFDYKKMRAAAKKYGITLDEAKVERANERMAAKNAKKVVKRHAQVTFDVNEAFEQAEEETFGTNPNLF